MTTTSAITEDAATESIRTAVWAGALVGIIQTFSPAWFWWLHQDVVWAIWLVGIAFVYIGFAVADGRPRIIATEATVTMGFAVVAAAGITVSPWLLVGGLVGHGLKDLWQHRTHFVRNTRWWPPFCMVVDFVCAAATAALLIAGVDF